MKVPNKGELEQIAINNISDIDFLNLLKSCTAKSYFFLVNDTILASGNSLRFRRNLL